MKTPCLKCGEEHRTGQCNIKEKINNSTCINCNTKGHMASSTDCPLFPKLRKGVEATLVALTPTDQEPFLVASIYAPPNPNYRNLGADLDALFQIFNTAIVAGDYNAKHTSWGCASSDPRDYALIKNLNWPCTADSLADLSSDHNPIRFYFPRTPKFEIPPPQLNTTWSIFTKILANPDNFDLPKANSTQEIDSQVSNLTSEILNTHTSASGPFYHSEQPYVQGELKELLKDLNKARKTWQQTRHSQHKTELNRLQNIIKRKIYPTTDNTHGRITFLP
ncbi:uncharacterized protein TNCV_4106911 [Trichonephila clavipes]|nr:uncharacterized protein TNCV_4106911 [Trichonephila clavipes]